MAQINELQPGQTVYLASGRPVVVREVYTDDAGVWVTADDGNVEDVVLIRDVHIEFPPMPAAPDSVRDGGPEPCWPPVLETPGRVTYDR